MNWLDFRNRFLVSFLYFLIIFLVGFIFGTIRTLFVTPNIGALFAVLLEVPFLLGISWILSLKIIQKFPFPNTLFSLLQIGGVSFLFLILTEVYFSLCLFGLTWPDYISNLTTPAGIVGFLAQVVFGLIPAIRGKMNGSF
jgi:hypothetical protein